MCARSAARIEGRRCDSDLVTGNFFQALGRPGRLGRPLTPEDDERCRPPGDRAQSQGVAQAVRGRSDGDRPKRAHQRPAVRGRRRHAGGLSGAGDLPPDYWAPLALVGQFRSACRQRGESRHRCRRSAEARAVAGGGDGRARRVGVGDEPIWTTPGVPRPSR